MGVRGFKRDGACSRYWAVGGGGGTQGAAPAPQRAAG